jgi:arsenate reductase
VLHEIGLDISGQGAETVERYLGEAFDSVITVCDKANKPAHSSCAAAA